MEMDLFKTEFWQNYGEDLVWCIGIAAFAILAKKSITQFVLKSLSWVSRHFISRAESREYASVVFKPLGSLIQLILIYVAVNQLGIILGKHALKRYPDRNHFMDPRFGEILDHLFLLLAIFFTVLFLVRTSEFLFLRWQQNAVRGKDPEKGQLYPFLKDLVQIMLWVIGIFWALGTVFHVNIPALVTGIGLGGLAIALAAKETVENLFATFTILWDKPFQLNDRIKLGGFEGRVTQIGLRSTRVEGDLGVQYIIPNKKLVTEAMENMSSSKRQKVRHEVHVKYSVTGEELRRRLASAQEMIRARTYVSGTIEMLVDQLGEGSMKLIISYHLAQPLPEGVDPIRIKQEIGLMLYDIMGQHAAS